MILKKIKKYLPEILTGIAVISVPIADILFIRAAKKEEKDHDKRHYILPSIVSSGTIIAVIISNKFSREQKAELIAAGILAGSERLNRYKDITTTVAPEKIDEINQKFDEQELTDISFICNEAEENGYEIEGGKKELYYFPQLYKAIQCNSADLLLAISNANAMLLMDGARDGRVSIADLFDLIDKTIMDQHIDDYAILERDVYDKMGFAINTADYTAGLQQITITSTVHNILYNDKIVDVTFIYFNEPILSFDEWDEMYYNLSTSSISPLVYDKEDREIERSFIS